MAEFVNLHDEGFQGRLFPHQRAKLREYFCLNPWPDTALLYHIAADIGAPVLIVSNYYDYVRNRQNQHSAKFQVSTQQQYVGLSAETIPRRMVEQYFKEKRSKEDDMVNMLDEILESPPSMKENSSDGDSFNCPVVENPSSSQDELRLALAEVGLAPGGQMYKFCSEFSEVPAGGLSDSTSDSSDQFLFNSDPKSGNELVKSELNLYSSTNCEPQITNSHSQQYSYNNLNPVQLSNQVQQFPHSGDHLQMFGQSYKTYPYQQSYPSLPSVNQKMLASSWPDLVRSRSISGQGQGRAWQQSRQSTEYEVKKDFKQLPPQHLFHQFIKPVVKSQFPFQSTESTTRPPDADLTRSCSSLGSSTVHKKELFHDAPLSPQDLTSAPTKIISYDPHPTSFGIIQKIVKAKHGKKGKEQTTNPNSPVSILSPNPPTVSRKRNSRCKVCPPCLDTDCGQCVYCLDKTKFGGPNRKKHACLYRRCLNMTSRRLSPRNSSKLICTPKKQLSGTGAFFSQALDDVPFEIEGPDNLMVPMVSGTWNLPQSKSNHQVRSPDSNPIPNPTSNPLKRHLPEDIKSRKKMRMDSVSHAQSISSEEIQQCTAGDVSSKEESYLKIYEQYNGVKCEEKEETKSYLLESIKHDQPLKDVEESHHDQSPLKERLHALRFDHCYAQNVTYFEGLDEEDHSGSKMNINAADNEDDSFERIRKELYKAVKGEEENLIIVKTEVASSPESEQHFVHAFPEVSDYKNSVKNNHSIDGKTLAINPFSDNVVHGSVQKLNLEDEAEELLVEAYDEFDSFEKKEIEESAMDVSAILTSFSAFDFGSLDTNNLLGESNENLVISPSAVKTETCLDSKNLKAEFSLRSVSDRSDQLLGSDGNSSPCSEGSISPPPDESKQQFTLDDLVSQSEYFQTRPSVLKLWKAKDQSLEVDKNLPEGWRKKVYTRKSGRMDSHYITPENMDVKTKFGVIEYMRLSRNYTMAEVERVAEYLKVRSDLK